MINWQQELDALQQVVIEATQKFGVDRVITQEVLEERCQHYLGVAKKELEACGPEESSDTSDFCPRATIFGARGEETPKGIPIGFNSYAEKLAKMHAISDLCKTLMVQAIILRMVGTRANLEKIGEAMGLNPPDSEQKFNYFHERMRKWMRQTYNTERFAGLPPEMRDDYIVVSGMGPKLEDAGLVSLYRWENGRLVCEDWDSKYLGVRLEMVPRWWQ